MAEESVKVLSISDLLKQSRPLTATSSLSLSRTIPLQNPHHPSTPPTSQNPNPNKLLTPLTFPTLLIGTLTVPLKPCSNTTCFSFSDKTATICCDIVNFDPHIINRNIHVLAWNFVPFKCGSGFLEIIRWSFPQCTSDVIGFPNLESKNLGSGSFTDSKARYFVHGVIESSSPVSVVPCATGTTNSSSVIVCSGKSSYLRGFLVNLLICECKFCNLKDGEIVLKCLNEEELNISRHCFEKKVIVYFCGSASCWHPVICKLIGNAVFISGLKKKLVYMGKVGSEVMYVTTEKSVLHMLRWPNRRAFSGKVEVKGKGELGVYIGTVTGVYMNGMVVELDQDVLLLLTDEKLSVPHSVRVGAIVSVRNVHFVNPRFSWTKVLVLGACVKTSLCLESFSPMQTGCHVGSQSHILLAKFINSLAFSARLWVLLVISCFRKKFVGMLSEKDILGSKQEEGLVQKYARSHLPSSNFHISQGVFVEYCKHDSCSCGIEPIDGKLQLAVPISDFISNYETTSSKLLLQRGTDLDILGNKNQRGHLFSEGRYIGRKILPSENIAALLGKLEISPASGRLQLVDATGGIDVVIPDLLSSSIKTVYEVNSFTIVLEGRPELVNPLSSLVNESFSCRSIFDSVPLLRDRKLTIYLYYHLRNQKAIDFPFYPCKDLRGNFEELKSGRFHLLWITHKYPVLQKFQGNQVVSNRSSIHAEAIILPWDLVLDERHQVTLPTKHSSGYSTEPMENYASRIDQEFVAHKKRKTQWASSGSLHSGFNDVGNGLCCHLNGCSSTCRGSQKEQKCCDLSSPPEIPCSISFKNINDHYVISSGVLHCIKPNVKVNTVRNRSALKVLLEFKPESFFKYEFLRIGRYYIIKHHNNACGGKIVITSGTNLWSFSFSADGRLLNIYPSHDFSFHDSFVSSDEFPSEGSCGNELSQLRFNGACPEICSDISLSLPSDVISLFETDIKSLGAGLIKPSVSLEKANSTCQGSVNTVITSTQFSVTSDSDCHLPQGDLISLQGHVLALYMSSHNSLNAHQPNFFQRLTSNICIHILVGHNIVTIRGSLSQNDCPIGFGVGVNATFHRILVFGRQNECTLIPASFIEINSISTTNHQYIGDHNNPLVASVSHTVLDAVPAVLISEIKHRLEYYPVQIHCRVVAVYILVLEKNSKIVYCHPNIEPKAPVMNIPLAGFVCDDGSSLCCCWVNNERASTFLRLHEEVPCEASERSCFTSKKAGTACNSSIGYVNTIIKQHGQLVVRNHGSISDPSRQDLRFSDGSNDAISSSDDNLLKSIILDACFSSSWTVVGNLMDLNATEQLEARLLELEMTKHPLRNIWVTEVNHTNPLTEAREALQGLLNM